MPLYEYTCEKCGQQSELLVNGRAQPSCPECGSDRLSKLLSMVAAPGRGTAIGGGPDLPPGPCGSGCGCFPQA